MPMHAKWIFVALICASSATAHAEGGCPPGSVPQSGQGWQTCVPISGSDDSDQQSGGVPRAFQRTDHWVDKWGAIATHGPTASVGKADGMPSRRMAEQTALDACHAQHGSTCTVLTYYRNGCGVMVIDGPGKFYVGSFGPTLDEATRKAMQDCTSSNHHDCHVFQSGCSLPVLVR
jgi:hypothetical protein